VSSGKKAGELDDKLTCSKPIRKPLLTQVWDKLLYHVLRMISISIFVVDLTKLLICILGHSQHWTINCGEWYWTACCCEWYYYYPSIIFYTNSELPKLTNSPFGQFILAPIPYPIVYKNSASFVRSVLANNPFLTTYLSIKPFLMIINGMVYKWITILEFNRLLSSFLPEPSDHEPYRFDRHIGFTLTGTSCRAGCRDLARM
jgi:hypothetical protein